MINKAIVLILVIIATSCSSGKPKIKVGENAFIYEQCLGANTEENFKRLTEVSNAKDESELKNMIMKGHVSVLNAYESVKVLDVKFGKVFVKTESDNRVWVSSEFVKAM